MKRANSPGRLIVSASNQALLDEASKFLDGLAPDAEVLVIAPTRGSADDFFFRSAGQFGSRAGVYRLTPAQLALTLATPALARAGHAPVSGLGQVALAARSAARCELAYFGPVARAPGFPRALTSTLSELRLERVLPRDLERQGAPGDDLARLLACYEEELGQRSLGDLAEILQLAAETARQGEHPLLGLPLLLLSLAFDSTSERAVFAALIARSPLTLATALASDAEAVEAFEEILGVGAEHAGHIARPRAATKLDEEGEGENSLARLRRSTFTLSAEAERQVDASFEFFSASGEGLECLEIARRILRAARSGVAFDQIAILLRHPDAYQPLVEEALRRAGIPGYFTRGSVRPDPAGRALLALLGCAAEGLSASKFAEYLSLGQVPALDESGAPRERPELWEASTDEAQASFKFPPPETEFGESGPFAAGTAALAGVEESDESPVIEGTLRTPFNWEKLLVDAAVIGGRDRWQRRLDGLEAELGTRLEEARREQGFDSTMVEKQLGRLRHLRQFALPVIDLLAQFTGEAVWSEWLERLRRLAGMTLRQPETVLAALAELEPMAEVGPVGLEEVRQALAERLSFLRREPLERRYGKVFVGTAEEARGRAFEMVFLPGLAEGLFPPRPSGDPLLLDEYREQLGSSLLTRPRRVEREKLLLKHALAAARSRLCASYPRTEVLEGRARVPSVFALEILRAVGGRLPPLGEMERRAAEGAEARLGWPAPRDPGQAIDDTEYDLAFLEPLLRKTPEETRGLGAYLVKANPHLARSLRTRAGRWRKRWSGADGIVDPDGATLEILAQRGLRQHTYSATALQQFAACPYRFLLYGIHGLRERETAVAIESLDPLTRGALFHEAQRQFFRALEQADLLPVTGPTLPRVLETADRVFTAVVAKYEELLAPAIPPVWTSETEALRTDFRGWVLKLPSIHAEWLPVYFEFAFGLKGEAARERDEASRRQAAVILGGVRLRGAIDLGERHRARAGLRVTDHKTGKLPQELPVSVGGGEALQPVLYGLAAEQLLEARVESGLLFYCTERGGYNEVSIPLDQAARQRIEKVAQVIDGHIRDGFLPAAPREGACEFCDYRPVCGPYEERRVKIKPPQRLEALNEVRCLP